MPVCVLARRMILCTLVDGPGECGGVRVTQEAGAAGIGVSLCETHPIDVARPLLATSGRAETEKGLFVYALKKSRYCL